MEPPANFKDRKRWYAQQARATSKLYPPKRKAKKPKGKKGNRKGHTYTPPECFQFFKSTDAARRYARKHRGLTKAEYEVWSRLAHDPHHKWHKQVPCGPYILDFYCRETNTAVEIDGPEHCTAPGIKRDNQRTGYLQHHHRIRVLRYVNDDAYLDGDILVAQIINDNLSINNNLRSAISTSP